MVSSTSQSTLFMICIYIISLIYAVFEIFLQSFSFSDELLTLIVLFYSILCARILLKKEFLFFLFVVCFYIIYSIIIHSNVVEAILRDAFLIAKPFICFYAAYYIKYNISLYQKRKLANLSLFLGCCLWCMLPFIQQIYPNTTSYYPPCLLCAVSYLFFSKREKKDWIIALLLMFPGLFSNRSKFYTEFILFVFIGFCWKKARISLKLVIPLLLVAVLSIFINWNKFSIYFISGVDSGVARSLLYFNAFSILRDFFPFGSGFGSYATDTSGKYYSDMYYAYDLNTVYGLSESDYGTEDDFFSDTFYPVLIGEFGLIGMVLFTFFWIKRYYRISHDSFRIKFFSFLLFFILVESIASPTFVTMTSLPLMFIIAMMTKEKY